MLTFLWCPSLCTHVWLPGPAQFSVIYVCAILKKKLFSITHTYSVSPYLQIYKVDVLWEDDFMCCSTCVYLDNAVCKNAIPHLDLLRMFS